MRLRKIVYARCNLQIDNNNIFLPYCPKKENAFLSFMEVILISNCTFISLSSFASQTIQIFLKTNICKYFYFIATINDKENVFRCISCFNKERKL